MCKVVHTNYQQLESKKKEKWTGEEVAVLLQEIETRKPLLFETAPIHRDTVGLLVVGGLFFVGLGNGIRQIQYTDSSGSMKHVLRHFKDIQCKDILNASMKLAQHFCYRNSN